MIKKVIKIHTNDPDTKIMTVSMSGEVGLVARLTPEMISLRGKPGEPISEEMKIVPAASPDFNIVNATARNGRDIDFTIEKQGTPPDSYFVLTVHNQKARPAGTLTSLSWKPTWIPKGSSKSGWPGISSPESR